MTNHTPKYLPSISCESCGGTGKSGADYCPVCHGEGNVRPVVAPPGFPASKAPFWVDDSYGWQMWENTTEGSPISPIFDTPEALAEWLTENGASAFGSFTMSRTEWLQAICGSGVGGLLVGSGGARPAVMPPVDQAT